MSALELPEGSPFDAIKELEPDGTERWSARRLMGLMGYTKWQNFERALAEAMTAAELSGVPVTSNFTAISNVSGS